jgi:hypothetical protein
LVPLGQLGEQVVEALGEALEQLVAGVDLDRGEAAAGGDLVHGLGQALDRLDHPVR